MQERKEYKKLLIYLYNQFNGSQALIVNELVEKKLKASSEVVNAFIKDNNIKLTDYVAFFEAKFPKPFTEDATKPVLIINKKLDKPASRFLGRIIMEKRMTLRQLLDELELPYSTSTRKINQILEENGCKPLIW